VISHSASAYLIVSSVVFALAKLSWVHRDLSVSNVFYFQGSLKLGDLEYAKKFGPEADSGQHDFRTVVCNS
jgi:hypothetical protein